MVAAKPKEFRDDGKQRDADNINNNITEVLKCYKDIAVREKYITRDEMPEIDRLQCNLMLSIKEIF